jgi:hypothetical protein
MDARLAGLDAVHLAAAAGAREEELQPFREAAARAAFGS